MRPMYDLPAVHMEILNMLKNVGVDKNQYDIQVSRQKFSLTSYSVTVLFGAESLKIAKL